MKHVAAYLLCVLGGNKSPSADDVTALLKSVEVEVDEAKLASLIKDLEGKDIDSVLESGLGKLASVPSGGGGAAGGAAGGSGDAKEEEKEEEEEEEEEEVALGGIVGGDDDGW